ncbi:MAG: 50S ribosomal protein L29 [Clostridia bacterium]|nr:50S ribosomal protein L29 [Clostridia bacterium]
MKNNYNNMSIQELIAEEEKLRKELFNMNFLNKVGQLQNNSSIRTTKKNIARVKTALQAKKLAGAKE